MVIRKDIVLVSKDLQNGKTSLAKKGISKCLTDEDGNQRPFSFIALGGSSNGSA